MENIFKDLEALNPKTAKSYFDEQYELNRPLRTAACNKYYEDQSSKHLLMPLIRQKKVIGYAT